MQVTTARPPSCVRPTSGVPCVASGNAELAYSDTSGAPVIDRCKSILRQVRLDLNQHVVCHHSVRNHREKKKTINIFVVTMRRHVETVQQQVGNPPPEADLVYFYSLNGGFYLRLVIGRLGSDGTFCCFGGL